MDDDLTTEEGSWVGEWEEASSPDDGSEVSDEGEGDDDQTDARTIVCKPYHWTYEDHQDPIDGFKSYVEIKISGHSLTNETVYIKVEDFRPYVYLQLPTGKVENRDPVVWNKARRGALIRHFQETLKHRGPISYVAAKRRNLYFKDPILALKVYFRTHRDILNFSNRVYDSKGIFITTMGRRFPYGAFKVHEQKIDPILKFTAQRRLQLADWFRCTEVIPEHLSNTTVYDRKFSTAKIDALAGWESFETYDPGRLIDIKYKCISFDIECYSRNHNSKIPDPLDPANLIFSIACTVYTDGILGSRYKILLTLFDPHDQPPDVINEIRRFKTERGLLRGFAKAVLEFDPDALVTYNGMKFDWNYMLIRAREHCDCISDLKKISRIFGKECPEGNISWGSNAYGEQNFKYLDPEGRLNIDVLTEVQRNYRLTLYNLNFVADHFLKEQKDPISARQLFMLYDLTDRLLAKARLLPKGVMPKEERSQWKAEIQSILKKRWCTGPTLELRTQLLRFGTSQRLVWLIRQALTLTGIYNVRDTILPIDLSDKLGLTTTMEQTANIMQVPMSYLHTRGQQIKVVAQVHRDTIDEGLIIPHIPKESIVIEPYMGAMVVEVVPGNYDDLLIFDFESLYPCMMITANICYTTLLREGDPTPDEECNIVKRSEHRGCEHDHSGKKIKADKRLCVEKIYRFRKVIYHPDGTREHEGVMPALERKLMSSRNAVKRLMAEAEAKIACATGKATSKDRDYFKSQGWVIPDERSLTEDELYILKLTAKVLNARQLSLKVSANSAYGILGAQTGFIPFIPGASSVTAMGRMMILKAIEYILTTFTGEIRNGKLVGKSKLIYGDTDSCLIQVLGLNTEELWPRGIEMSKETTHFLKCWWLKIDPKQTLVNLGDQKAYRLDKFPRGKDDCNVKALSPKDASMLFSYLGCPINLQIENYYKRIILLTKKRYMTYMANGEGKIIGKNKKGVITVRRENCQWVKGVYDQTSIAILDKEPREKIIDNVLFQNFKLHSNQVKDAEFIVYTGISSVISYAKKNKAGNYINSSDEVIEGVEGPLDPRLIYQSLGHVNLARKMLARGEDVPPNTRMEYVFLEDESIDLASNKTEDYTYFRENKAGEGLRLDYFHYQEKLIEPMTELLDVIFPGEPVIYEKLEKSIEREYQRLVDEEPRYGALLDELIRVSKGRFVKKPSRRWDLEVEVGYGALNLSKQKPEAKIYTFKGLPARYEYYLDSIRRGDSEEEHIDPTEGALLKNLILRWKSNFILKRSHKKYGAKTRKYHMPKNRNHILRITSGDEPQYVMLAEGEGRYPRGTIVKLVKATDATETLDIQVSEKKKGKEFLYDVLTEDGKVLDLLTRDRLAPFYTKDHFFMKDLRLAHSCHRGVCDEIKTSEWVSKFLGRIKNKKRWA